jgi:hypothetical protein
VIEIAERFAEGVASAEELANAHGIAWKTSNQYADGNEPHYWLIAAAAHVVDASAPVAGYSTPSNLTSAINAASAPLEWGGEIPAWVPAGGDTPVHKCQAHFVRDIFGNPFRLSPPLASAVLAWKDRTIHRLARAIYEERKMLEGTFDNARLGILADALLDAGCDDDDLIQHCRSPGPHVRGCWAVDLCLGKS